MGAGMHRSLEHDEYTCVYLLASVYDTEPVSPSLSPEEIADLDECFAHPESIVRYSSNEGFFRTFEAIIKDTKERESRAS